MSGRDAARALRVDHRTVQKMIESGELAGGARVRANQLRWYVYVDQIPSAPAPGDSSAEVSRLRDELAAERASKAEVQAQLTSAQESNRLLLAGQAQLREALADSQRALGEMTRATQAIMEGADAYRRGAEGYAQVIANLQSSSVRITGVAENYADALSQYNWAGNVSELTDMDD